MLTETLTDPRILSIADEFVWVKIDSDKQTEYKASFDQKGFPGIAILDPDGDVQLFQEGFRDARTLRHMLTHLQTILFSANLGHNGS